MQFQRVGLVGDVHAQHRRLEAALRSLAAKSVEILLCVGDVVDGVGDADRCCQLLREHNVLTVRGNHDRWLLKGEMRDLPHITPRAELSEASLEWLAALPTARTLETARGKLLLGHGVGQYDMKGVTPDDYGYALESNAALQQVLYREWCFVVGGHTHQRMVRPIGSDGTGHPIIMINPGALQLEEGASFALADFEQGQVTFYEFDGDSVRPAGTTVSM